jgi:beta-lactamase regulating signal transducer with metallopeptidase domain
LRLCRHRSANARYAIACVALAAMLTTPVITAFEAVSASITALLPVLVSVWLAGVTLLVLRMVAGLWRVHRLQLESLAADASRWQAAVQRIARRLGLGVAVHVVELPLVDAPATIGYLRPVIVLPDCGACQPDSRSSRSHPCARADPHPAA